MTLQKGGEKLGYESEAFAIYDTMKYIKPSVRTLCVGTAFGESAMLLAAGEKVLFCSGTSEPHVTLAVEYLDMNLKHNQWHYVTTIVSCIVSPVLYIAVG